MKKFVLLLLIFAVGCTAELVNIDREPETFEHERFDYSVLLSPSPPNLFVYSGGDCLGDGQPGDYYDGRGISGGEYGYCLVLPDGTQVIVQKDSRESTPEPTLTSVPTGTPNPTSTPVLTNTPNPTLTPVPTNTPDPTKTPKLKKNNGHGNNRDHCDVSNPSGKCPDKKDDPSGDVDDEKNS